MNVPIFYTKKPVFGFDLGHSTIKMMQITTAGGESEVTGYGHVGFESKALKNGVIIDPELVAKQVYALTTEHMIGDITTKRVVASLPAANTYNRVLLLPELNDKELNEAVMLEAGQYIPLSIEELYVDYQISSRVKGGQVEVLMVAAPKVVVDSYITLFDLLGLEVALLETSIHAVSRIVEHADRTGIPTLIIDFGAVATDLAVVDEDVKITGSTEGGGETITNLIAKHLDITTRQAYSVKTDHGLDVGKKQRQILKALEPLLKKLLIEIRKMHRYYEERSAKKRKVEQIIILGGGANLPGLSAYLTDKVRLPTRLVNPWQHLSFGSLQPPHKLETTLYTTAAGLSLVESENFK
jgi:type IV pilus assembly protein PilM